MQFKQCPEFQDVGGVDNIVTCYSDSVRDFGLVIGFIDHLNTQLVTTLNYSTIVYLHTLQFTRAQSLVCSVCY
jgi:hypothetical protein